MPSSHSQSSSAFTAILHYGVYGLAYCHSAQAKLRVARIPHRAGSGSNARLDTGSNTGQVTKLIVPGVAGLRDALNRIRRNRASEEDIGCRIQSEVCTHKAIVKCWEEAVPMLEVSNVEIRNYHCGGTETSQQRPNVDTRLKHRFTTPVGEQASKRLRRITQYSIGQHQAYLPLATSCVAICEDIVGTEEVALAFRERTGDNGGSNSIFDKFPSQRPQSTTLYHFAFMRQQAGGMIRLQTGVGQQTPELVFRLQRNAQVADERSRSVILSCP